MTLLVKIAFVAFLVSGVSQAGLDPVWWTSFRKGDTMSRPMADTPKRRAAPAVH